MTDWPFAGLQPHQYGVIMVDPPWRFGLRNEKTGAQKSAQRQYCCESIEEIQALPVAHLAAQNCLLWLWATAPMLPHALETMRAWGFRYVTMGSWAKRSKTGRKWAFGTGYVLRSAVEPFLLGAIGRPETASNSVRNLLDEPVREHSRKPEQAYAAAEALRPESRKAELFARYPRSGWDVWGDEVSVYQEASL